MGYTNKQLIKDPEHFIVELEESLRKYIDKVMADKSAEWANRGDAKTIRSSNFGTCIRRSYYDYFSQKDQKIITGQSDKERMFLGFIGEDIMHEYFKEFLWSKVDITGHTKQNVFPVHLNSPNNPPDIRFVATTDFVHEVTIDGVRYYIPMELKTTQLAKWAGFRHWKHHLMQILTWIYIGKEQDLNIPYGVLVYCKNLFDWYKPLEIKVNLISVDTPFRKTDRIIEEYNVWKHYISARRQELIEGIQNKTLPVMPIDVPIFICNQCPFKTQCFSNINANTSLTIADELDSFDVATGE